MQDSDNVLNQMKTKTMGLLKVIKEMELKSEQL